MRTELADTVARTRATRTVWTLGLGAFGLAFSLTVTAAYLPPLLDRFTSSETLIALVLEVTRRLLGMAVEAGTFVLAGTDLVGTPAQVAAEALKLEEYGLGAKEAVDAVSVSGLSATGRPTGFEPGSPANAVFFPVDPYEEPGVLAHPAQVLRHGRLV